MSAKFIWMSDKIPFELAKGFRNKIVWGKPFKWQWALFYEENIYLHGGWKNQCLIFNSRGDARSSKFDLRRRKDIRNLKMKRRLVQANWEDYNDSFSYNAKGNGNGR